MIYFSARRRADAVAHVRRAPLPRRCCEVGLCSLLDRLGDIGYESFEEVLKLEPPAKHALTQNAADGVEWRATRATNADELYAQALEEFQMLNGQVRAKTALFRVLTSPFSQV